MITNSKLLIDSDCPLCKLYGKAFLKLGLIEKDVLSSYQQVEKSISKSIDMTRAKSEIALINLKDRKVDYGIDAFARILTNDKSLPRFIIKTQPFRFLFKLLYSLISWNRHVIVRPSATCSSPICAPDLHRGYRIGYYLLSAVVAGFIFNHYLSAAFSMGENGLPAYYEYLLSFGILVAQASIVLIMDKRKTWDYLSHLSTVMIIGSLLLVPPYLIASFLNLPLIYLMIAFGMVVVIMIQEHSLRTKRLGIGMLSTITWVSYLMLTLAAIMTY